MIAAYLLFGGLVASFACSLIFLTIFIARGATYRDQSEPEYSRLTWGNPLNALFIERLLTHEGLRFRSFFCWTLAAVWGLVLVAGIAVNFFG